MFPLERARRIERPTLTLARLCSTPELRPQSKWEAGYDLSARRFQAGFEQVVPEKGLRPSGGLPPRPAGDRIKGGDGCEQTCAFTSKEWLYSKRRMGSCVSRVENGPV